MSIIAKLFGGMGNQMFQYALGRHLAHINRTALQLDLDYFHLPEGEHTSRAFGLDVFTLEAQRADQNAIRSARHAGSPIRAFLHGIHPRLASDRVVRERSFTFDPKVLHTPDVRYLEGYWQSENYFLPITSIIRQEFQFRGSPAGANAARARQIGHCTAVSLHVRRGDYVSQSAANAHFHVLGPEYYAAAMDRMLERMPDAEFFVFSDDPVEAKAQLPAKAPLHFVEGNAGDATHEDMRLMSLCQHHIMANSSFSWWGAWLNPSPEKLVIAPVKWFRDPSINTRDLLPPGWMRI